VKQFESSNSTEMTTTLKYFVTKACSYSRFLVLRSSYYERPSNTIYIHDRSYINALKVVILELRDLYGR